MQAIPPAGADALATKADVATLRGELRTDIAHLGASVEAKLRGQTQALGGGASGGAGGPIAPIARR